MGTSPNPQGELVEGNCLILGTGDRGRGPQLLAIITLENAGSECPTAKDGLPSDTGEQVCAQACSRSLLLAAPLALCYNCSLEEGSFTGWRLSS